MGKILLAKFQDGRHMTSYIMEHETWCVTHVITGLRGHIEYISGNVISIWFHFSPYSEEKVPRTFPSIEQNDFRE